MNKLDEARYEINKIDAEMAVLFEERMRAVKKVIEYKLENRLPVIDSKREAEIIEKNAHLINEFDLQPYYKEYLKMVMEISKKYQAKFIK